MPEVAQNVAYLEHIFAVPDGLRQFQYQDSVIYTSIPSDSLADHKLPDFVSSLATVHGEALSQLISEAGMKQGACFYGGWIDQAVFTIRQSSTATAAGIQTLLPLLASDPTDQNGDSVIGFIPDDTTFISLVYVSRETRFAYMSHYCDSTAVHAELTAAR